MKGVTGDLEAVQQSTRRFDLTSVVLPHKSMIVGRNRRRSMTLFRAIWLLFSSTVDTLPDMSASRPAKGRIIVKKPTVEPVAGPSTPVRKPKNNPALLRALQEQTKPVKSKLSRAELKARMPVQSRGNHTDTSSERSRRQRRGSG